jgi:ketosteroid isomerase-like protein
MAADSDADVIRRGYDAFERGDMDMLRADLFSADIKWHQSGRHPYGDDQFWA